MGKPDAIVANKVSSRRNGSDAKSDSLCSLDLDAGAEEMRRKTCDRRGRSKSLSLPCDDAVSVPGSSSSTNPLFCKDDDELIFKAERAGGGGCQPIRGPLSLISGLVSCWHGRRRNPDARAWERRRASALVELSKRQQAALADKQDTIDMLEWQLEQLQAMAGREHELQELERTATYTSATSSPSPPPPPPPTPPPPTPAAAPPALRSKVQEQSESAADHESDQVATVIGAEVSATVLLFEMAVIRARLSIRYFCNVFIKQMEASGYPVCRTLADMEPASSFLRKEHTAFVLDSRINKAFFHCFENDSFDDSGLMRILDTGKRCTVRLEEYKRMKLLNVGEAVSSSSPAFEPEFLKFCQSKTKDMWALFHINMAFKSLEEREAFTAAFLDVAKAVWLLHRLAFSMNPAVVIIRVGKGMDMNPLYVEPVAVPEQGCRNCASSNKVEFMIMPGFRAHKKVIKCQVYPHVECK